MSRWKEMSRGGWIVIGIAVALLLVPTGVATAPCSSTRASKAQTDRRRRSIRQR
jgi:hypothetical protein